MLVACSPLPDAAKWKGKIDADGTMSLGNFTLVYGELQTQYNECAIRNDCLIEAVQGTSKTAKSAKCVTTKSTKDGK